MNKKDYEKVTKGNKGKPQEKIELFMKKRVIKGNVRSIYIILAEFINNPQNKNILM